MIMKKIGSINPAMPMALYSKRGRIVGWCMDTPNSFACACQMSDKVFKGIANYPGFGETIRLRDSQDNQERMTYKLDCCKLSVELR